MYSCVCGRGWLKPSIMSPNGLNEWIDKSSIVDFNLIRKVMGFLMVTTHSLLDDLT